MRARSVSTASDASTTARLTHGIIDKGEPCFISKRPSYTLERTHWVATVKNNPQVKTQVEGRLKELGIVHHSFNLNDTSNLTNLDCTLRVSLEKYAFIAVTASLITLQKLIHLVEEQNHLWQGLFDKGIRYTRIFDLQQPPFTDAQYELVVLHPEHFLPIGSSLTFFTRVDEQLQGKAYVVGHDRTLRESPGTANCPRLPAFTFDARRNTTLPLNPFLVVLNAEIKFRRFRRMKDVARFPDEVEALIDKSVELMKVIYWQPEKKGSYWERVAASIPKAVAEDAKGVGKGSDDKVTGDDEGDKDTPGKSSGKSRGSHRVPEVKDPGKNATQEQRMDYDMYLMSGSDFEINSDDEALLEEMQCIER